MSPDRGGSNLLPSSRHDRPHNAMKRKKKKSTRPTVEVQPRNAKSPVTRRSKRVSSSSFFLPPPLSKLLSPLLSPPAFDAPLFVPSQDVDTRGNNGESFPFLLFNDQRKREGGGKQPNRNLKDSEYIIVTVHCI